MALISGSLPPQTCYGTPQQLLDLFAQYLSTPTQNVILEATTTINTSISGNTTFKTTIPVSVAGASVGDVVVVGCQALNLVVADRIFCDGFVSSANSVTIRIHNLSGSSASVNGTFKIKVLKAS